VFDPAFAGPAAFHLQSRVLSAFVFAILHPQPSILSVFHSSAFSILHPQSSILLVFNVSGSARFFSPFSILYPQSSILSVPAPASSAVPPPRPRFQICRPLPRRNLSGGR